MRRIAAVALVASALLAGCRTVTPPQPIEADTAATRSLVDSLAAERQARHALRGTLRLALDGPQGSFRANQVLVAQQPAQLRVEVQGFLAQTVAVLVTDGTRFELFRARERTLEYGPVYPGLLRDVARIDLDPAEAVPMLLGAPPVPDGLHVARAFQRGDETELELADGSGATRLRLAFGSARELRRAERLDGDGAPIWRATYDDFRPLGGVPFAYSVHIGFPPSSTEASVDFQQVELNPPLPQDAFVFRVPPGVASPPRPSEG
ncbi:MAG TPA: hypothetical protein VMW35_05745 [Myxococcota bacterium]|jgi:hypothetical protein|nr:hypothetical protein [Myxococcota bacterium]